VEDNEGVDNVIGYIEEAKGMICSVFVVSCFIDQLYSIYSESGSSIIEMI